MYYVFAGDVYYPSGGSRDLVKFTEDLSEAIQFAVDYIGGSDYKWAEVCGADDVKGLVREWEG